MLLEQMRECEHPSSQLCGVRASGLDFGLMFAAVFVVWLVVCVLVVCFAMVLSPGVGAAFFSFLILMGGVMLGMRTPGMSCPEQFAARVRQPVVGQDREKWIRLHKQTLGDWRQENPNPTDKLGTRTLLGAPGLTTRSKDAANGAPGHTTSNKKLLETRSY